MPEINFNFRAALQLRSELITAGEMVQNMAKDIERDNIDLQNAWKGLSSEVVIEGVAKLGTEYRNAFEDIVKIIQRLDYTIERMLEMQEAAEKARVRQAMVPSHRFKDYVGPQPDPHMKPSVH